MAEQQHHPLPELTLLLSTRSRNKQQRKAKCSCACSWPRMRGGTGHGQRARAWPSLTGWFLLLGSASTAAAAASGAACTTHWASKEGQAAPSHTPISCQNKRAESHCLALDTSPNPFRAELFFFFLFKVLVFFGNHSDSAQDPDPKAAPQEHRQSSFREALKQAVAARMLGACCTRAPPDSRGLGLDSASTSRAEP